MTTQIFQERLYSDLGAIELAFTRLDDLLIFSTALSKCAAASFVAWLASPSSSME